MNKIAFVILHYITIYDTIKCIESIENIMKDSNYNYEIVIVDNYSNNGTAEELENDYKGEENVHIIRNSKNLGFANGNNVGFKYAKENLNCNYIVMLNNDTYILQEDFAFKIFENYEKYNYAILGPKIILKDGTINPIRNKLPSIKQLRKSIFINRLLYIVSYLNFNTFYEIIMKKLNKKQKGKKKLDVEKFQDNIIIHGCCLIFSPQYINKFDGIDTRTFLYCEEELLFIRIKRSKMISIYNPDLEIYHMEDGATNAITKDSRNKKMFKYQNAIKSKKILYNELKLYYNQKGEEDETAKLEK